MLSYLNEWLKNDRGNRIFTDWVVDPQGIFKTNKYCLSEGVYSIDIVEYCSDGNNKVIHFYVGEIGATNSTNTKSHVAEYIPDRILQHLKAWLNNGFSEYWTGVSENDLINGKYKFLVQILEIENNYEKRKQLEAKYILLRQPFLQYSSFKKWNCRYSRPDLTIVPFNGTRKKAFIEKLKERHPEMEYVQTTNLDKDWLTISKLEKPSNDLIERVSLSVEKYSDLHKTVKERLDNVFGFNAGSRGCTYNFIVTLLSKAYVYENSHVN